MVKKGIIYLLDKGGGEIVTAKPYDSVSQRKKIIDGWRKMYAAKFYQCILQISPYVDTTRIKQDGTNSYKIPNFITL